MGDMETCDWCGRNFEVSSIGCEYESKHKNPDMAERIVHAIEDDLMDRRGLRHEWDRIDEEILSEIRESWAERVRFIVEDKE